MARMKLRKSTRIGDYEVYPIYEIDFAGIAADTGYTQQESDDAVGTNAYKYREWKSINNNLINHIAANIPRQENQPGNIIPFWHRYNNLVGDRYMLDTDNLSSYAAVEQAKRPDDWGTNPNYITLVDTETLFRKIQYPSSESIDSSWSSSTSYYEDTKRTNVRMFYTDTGCSFACSKTTLWTNSNNYYFARCYTVGVYPTWNYQGYSKKSYSYTGPNGNILDNGYYIKDNLGVNVPSSEYQKWDSFPDGYNCQMVFVHFVENGTTDFYGVAIIQMSDFSENSYPVAIHVSAWDATFWGTSIISGGGGSGSWTNDGPTSYVQGGTGKFDAPSDNRGDRDGTEVINITSDWGARYNALCAGGYKKYVLGFNQQVDDSAAFAEFMDKLWDPGIFQAFLNYFLSPIDSILACHLVPNKFSPPFATTEAGKDNIVAAKVELTPNHKVSKFYDLVKSFHIGSVDIKDFSDSFADYTNTAIYIHLPYVGTQQIDVNACMGGWISVDYSIDYLTGDCIAFITTCDREGNKHLRYAFKGNCAKPIPVKQMGGNLIGPAIAVASTAASVGIATAQIGGAAIGAVAPAVSIPLKEGVPLGYTIKETLGQMGELGIGDAVRTAARGAANGVKTGAISSLLSSGVTTSSTADSGSATAPVDTVCYVIIQRPMWSAPEEYGKQFGYPSDIGGTINQSNTEAGDPFTNFLSVRSIELDNVSGTDEEKTEIEQLMMSGIYVSND